jgi:serine/threonine protein kinase
MEDAAEHFFALGAGVRLDEYEIVSIVGHGSFGITYLAEDINLGTRLAIKEYLPGDWAVRDSTKSVRPKSPSSRASFELGMNAFLKEARTLANISHPNIVEVRRFLRANGTAYIVMDFIEGHRFSDVLTRDYPSGGFPSAPLNALLIALLDGLTAVHGAGIIHRDIKPGNILITTDGDPILIDFGAARSFQRTLRGMTVIMTPGYAPIEQYTEDSEQGACTDIYSLGAVAYRAITGRTPMEPYKRISGGIQPSAASVGAGKYPAALLSAIDWAISVHPKDRPQSATELARLLRDDDADETRVILTNGHRRTGPEIANDRANPSLGSGVLGRSAGRRAIPIAAASVAVAIAVVALANYGSFLFNPTTDGGQRQTDRPSTEAGEKAAAEAAQKEVEKKAAAEAAQREAEKRAAAEAAQLEAAKQAAAEAAQREAETAAAAAAAREDAERAAAAKRQPDRKAAEAAKREADRKTALAAKRNAERRAANEAQRREQERLREPEGQPMAPLSSPAPAAQQPATETIAPIIRVRPAKPELRPPIDAADLPPPSSPPAATDNCQGRSC